MRRILLWATLLIVVNACFALAPRLRYRAIVVHHSASDTGDFRTIRRAHLARGWTEIAYHLVLSNGSTAVPAGHLQATRRYALGLWSVATRSPRHNVSAVHLCAIGNFEARAPDPSTQMALGHAIRTLQDRYGIPDDRILLHRDCSATMCPGREVTRERLVDWTRQAAELPPALREQHRRTIRQGWLRPIGWWGANAVLIGLWFRRSRRAADRDPPPIGLDAG